LRISEQDILIEALKGALLLAILERLVLTSNASWLEDHIDYMSLQARAACICSVACSSAVARALHAYALVG
jgi:hypothetical protein